VEKKKLAAGSRRRLEEKKEKKIKYFVNLTLTHDTPHTTHNQQKTHRQDKDTTAGIILVNLIFFFGCLSP
jgi:hypothetical protein